MRNIYNDSITALKELDYRDQLIVLCIVIILLKKNIKINEKMPLDIQIIDYLKIYVDDKIICEIISRIFTETSICKYNEELEDIPVLYIIRVYTENAADYLDLFEIIIGEMQSLFGSNGVVFSSTVLTDLCTELANIREDDIVFDPCAGVGRLG